MTIYGAGNTDPGVGETYKCFEVNPVNGIATSLTIMVAIIS
jgi:hypothetical protein